MPFHTISQEQQQQGFFVDEKEQTNENSTNK